MNEKTPDPPKVSLEIVANLLDLPKEEVKDLVRGAEEGGRAFLHLFLYAEEEGFYFRMPGWERGGEHFAFLVELSARVWGVRAEEMLSRDKSHEVVMARFAVMFALRTLFGWTFPRIGKALGRDHGTVIYGVEQVQNIIDTGDREACKFEEILNLTKKRYEKQE